VSEGAVTTAGGATQFMEASTELAGVAEELAGLVAAFRV